MFKIKGYMLMEEHEYLVCCMIYFGFICNLSNLLSILIVKDIYIHKDILTIFFKLNFLSLHENAVLQLIMLHLFGMA